MTMKHLFTLLIGLLAFSSSAQNFALPVAEWKYSYHSAMGAIGYMKINEAGDTLIEISSNLLLQR
jgi:hypothetical protein